MRKTFAEELYTKMLTADDTWLLLGDVGYGIFDYTEGRFLTVL
jgi:hypothetical protein